MEAQLNEKSRNELKQKGLTYMPRDLGSVQSQKQILKMLADVLPSVKPCIQQANTQLWPKVEAGEMPINQAIARCAYQANQAIAAVGLKNVRFSDFSEEILLRAWIALEYYTFVLKEAYSVDVRNAQEKITAVLLNRRMPANKTVPAEDKAVRTPQKKVSGEESQKTSDTSNTGAVNPEKKNLQKQSPAMPATSSQNEKPTQPVTAGAPAKPAMPKKKPKTGLLIAVSVAAILVGVLVSPLFSKTNQTRKAIDRIGAVTLESEEAILSAEAMMSELTEDQIGKVENYSVLQEARTEFDRLKTQEAIDSIGKVTMESEAAIGYAEELYDALPRLTRGKVENYVVLNDARKELTRLQTAVSEAKSAIDAIGTVTLESGDAIRAARTAYDALKADNLESYVDDRKTVLLAAEKTYAQYASEDLYNTGYALYENGNYEDALAKFDILISSYPDSPSAASAKGVQANCQVELARKASRANDNYTAIKMLNSVEEQYRTTKEYQELLTSIQNRLKNSRPYSGTSIDGSAGWGQCYFEITAPETDVCVKIKDCWGGDTYKMVYIRAGETKKINIEDGMYAVSWATGDYWYGKDHLFGDETQYMQVSGMTTFTTRYEGSWVYYYYSQIDLSDDGLSVKEIQQDEF